MSMLRTTKHAEQQRNKEEDPADKEEPAMDVGGRRG